MDKSCIRYNIYTLERNSQTTKRIEDKIMERKVGEIFEYEGIKLEVVETEDFSCHDCYFLTLRCECSQQLCMFYNRKDRKNVVFQLVE